MLPALFSSLQVRLLLLLLLALLPGFAMTFYLGFEQRQQAIANAQAGALQLARVTAANQGRLLDAERQLLVTIAELPVVLIGDAAACHARLADLRQQYPRYVNLTVVTPAGETSCSAVPFTPPVSVAQRSWFQRATSTRTFVVGDYQVGTITGKATLNVAYPILGQNHQIQAIVVAALDVDWLNQVLAEAQPSAGTTLSLIDRWGTIVAHYPDPERWVGQSLPEAPIVRTVLAHGQGTADLPDLDGVARLFAFQPLVDMGEQASLSIVIGMTKSMVFAEADWGFIRSLMVLGVVALAAMAVARVVADWLILRQVKALLRATGQVAAGDLSGRTGLAYDRGELGQLARAFDDMAQALETRQAQAAWAETALQRAVERLELLHQIDRALIAEERPEAIAAAALQPLRELLGVPRAIVNLFDLAAGEVEWLAAVGRRRLRLGPGVRYSMRFMGDVEALQRGEPQMIDVHSLPPGPEAEALLASGVHVYMVVPMIAGGELIGALSFGGAPGPFPPEQIDIAQETAMQLAIAIAHARLHEHVKRQAEDLELRVGERTQELYTAQAKLQTTNVELVQLTSKLEAANKELEAFSYSASHDLRAPLRSIDGFSQVLLEDYGDTLDAQGQDHLRRIRMATQRMAELIDALLELSRVTRMELSRRPLDLTAMAQTITEELRRREPARAVELVLADGLTASGDPPLLRVALENLLGNAWKFTAKTALARIEIGSLRQPDGVLAYFVCDNGAGFDMQYADKLFGAFQRLHRVGEFPGTGIGLATVQRIIHRHGGRIWAEGIVDHGSTFYFTLEHWPV
ncbi:MAG TPA: cache domain-containing protein [Candidatus Tectomicrobia bacterium]